MSALLQIRGVPEETRRQLMARAATRGQSLNVYLLDLIEREAKRPSVREVLDRAARRAEQGTGSAREVLQVARAEREEQLTSRRGS